MMTLLTGTVAGLSMWAALWTIPTSEPSIAGWTTYYAPDVMEQVAANRGMDLTGYAGGVALNRRGDLGRKIWIRWGDGTVEGPFLVVDCAARQDYPARETAGLVLEVDAQTARRSRFFGIGPVPVVVHFVYPLDPENAL
jgi:hypothetical protein